LQNPKPVALASKPLPRYPPRATKPRQMAKQQPAVLEQQPAKPLLQHLQLAHLHQADQQMASQFATSVAAKATLVTAASSPFVSAVSSSGT